MNHAANREYFAKLFLRHSRALYSHVRAQVPHPQDADDVFQETCIVLWQKFDQYRPNTNFLAWACRIAHYKALKLHERHHRSPRLFGPEFQEIVGEEMIVMDEVLEARSAALRQCREKLNQRDRDLLQRYYRPGATAKIVARYAKRSIHYVYRAMRRIHDTLHECISKTLIEDSIP